jgi:hypothetical protein
MLAHSGANIGVAGNSGPSAPDREIPVSYPTILEQCKTFGDTPQTVDLVLLNGGINDIDIRTILNPMTSFKDLGDRTKLHCYYDVKELLKQTCSIFARATIVVIGYYPILSTKSELLRVLPLLQLHAIAIPPHLYSDPILTKVISLCLQFWHDSDMWLARAVEESNSEDNRNRIVFVQCPFTEDNAVFASTPWLWGVGPSLTPQDEVSDLRIPACAAYYTSPEELLSREQCFRASAGHPNVSGAAAIANQIASKLGALG